MTSSFDLGGFIRDQRRTAQLSLRQLARIAGVSNPYLSQIERGLRRPSAEIMQQIAKGLRISAEALYVQAGILDERIAGGVVVDAVLADATLTERQKQVMLEVYDSFRKENQRRVADDVAAAQAADAAVAQATESAAGQASGSSAPSPDAFAEAVDQIDAGFGPGFEAGGEGATPGRSAIAPPMRTTMTRHNPRRLP